MTETITIEPVPLPTVVVEGEPRGPVGPTGPQGTPGTAATVAVGTVTTGAPGSSAAVSNSGTSTAAVLDVTIPAGQTGATGAPGGGAQQGAVTIGANFAQAPSAAEADVPGMTLTYTAPATPKPIEFVISGMVQHAGGSSDTGRVCGLRLYEGATYLDVIVSVSAGAFPATGGIHSFTGRCRLTPTAGPHTYKLRAIANISSGATITWLAGASAFNLRPMLFTIDEH